MKINIGGVIIGDGSPVAVQSMTNTDTRDVSKTVYQIAKALNLSMEDIIELEDNEYNSETGMPNDEAHFECGLPRYVQESLERMKKSWEIVDSGKKDMNWDVCWCELNADLNSAEVENLISSEQAWYLRRKYLRMENAI